MKKQFIVLLLIFVCLLLFVGPSYASPVINEFSSADGSDWIEIYNPGQDTVDLSLFRIRDATENNKLELSGILSPLGFAVFDWSNKLNNGGDLIKIILISNESVIDQTVYGDSGGISAPVSGQSIGRKTDGGVEWVLFSSHSKGSSNNSVAIFTPPSPTPSKTPTSTKAPIPTKTPTSTKSGSNISKTPTPKSSTAVSNPTSGVSGSTSKSNFDKITQTVRPASEFAKIKEVTEDEDKNDVKILGAKDTKHPWYLFLSGILFLTSAGLILLKKVLKEKGIL